MQSSHFWESNQSEPIRSKWLSLLPFVNLRRKSNIMDANLLKWFSHSEKYSVLFGCHAQRQNSHLLNWIKLIRFVNLRNNNIWQQVKKQIILISQISIGKINQFRKKPWYSTASLPLINTQRNSFFVHILVFDLKLF